MFEKLTYKQKLKLTGIAGILALVLCYELSIGKTVDEYSKYSRSAEMDTHLNENGISVRGLRQDLHIREEKVKVLYDRFILDTLQPDKNLLSVASNYCKINDLKLKEYKTIGLSGNDGVGVLTRIVTVEGTFKGCLKLLDELERGRKVGKVSSVEFKSYTDVQDKAIKLNCTVYIQNLLTH